MSAQETVHTQGGGANPLDEKGLCLLSLGMQLEPRTRQVLSYLPLEFYRWRRSAGSFIFANLERFDG